MTADEIIKTVFGTILGAVVAATSWLISQVIKNKESIALQEHRVKNLEESDKSLKSEIEKVEEKALTVESVRGVLEEALDRRDREHERRRAEWDRTLKLEIKETVRDEIKNSTAKFYHGGTPRGPLRPPSDLGDQG